MKLLFSPFILRSRFALAVLGSVLTATGSVSAQDILCGCSERRFFRPGNCLQDCRKRISCSACMISPQCPAMQVQAFKQMYNQALFGIGIGMMGVPRGTTNTVLVAWIINNFWRPNRVTDFNVVWGAPENTSDWAHVEPAPASGGKMTLTISPDAIWLSPAGLVTSLGHEMIHVEQLKRRSSIRMTGLNSVLTSFRELEASSWETRSSTFAWSIQANEFYSCMAPDEKEGSQATLACRQWQVRKAIENVRTGLRSAQYMGALEKYMNEDPWISQIWLKQNPNWKSVAAGPAPASCENP